jgi:hypothetical protein
MSSKHNFQDITVINPQLSIFHFSNTSIYHKYNIVSTFMILDTSKEELYKGADMFKSILKKCEVIAGETDSLILYVRESSEEFISKLKSLSSLVDFSRLPAAHFLRNDTLAGKLGAWKLTELNIKEYVSLKPRLSSYITVCDFCKMSYCFDCEFCSIYKRGKLSGQGIRAVDKTIVTHRKILQLLFNDSLSYIESDAGGRRMLKFHSLDPRRYFHSTSDSLAFGHIRLRHGSQDIRLPFNVPI